MDNKKKLDSKWIWYIAIFFMINFVIVIFFASEISKRRAETIKIRDEISIEKQEDFIKKDEGKVANRNLSTAPPSIQDIQETTTTAEAKMLTGYEEYLALNEDVVGRIQIPDSNVDYPVLQYTDNEFYLSHNNARKESIYGAIFTDYRLEGLAKEIPRHTILYGHNMKDDSMFGDVVEYKEEKFLKNHSIIKFDNLFQSGEWKVFSTYIVDADKETVPLNFSDDEEYIGYLNKIKERSLYNVDVTLDKDTKLLTLCTCSYEYANGRILVHAVLTSNE